MKDQELHTPLPSGHRGPTPEQRAEAERWAARCMAQRSTERAAQLERHQHLVASHAHKIIAQLLAEHAPTELEHEGSTYTTCSTCGDDAVSWPCPTWTTISDNSHR